MALEVGKEGPRGFGIPPIGRWSGKQDPRLEGFGEAIRASGINIKQLLEALKGNPEVLALIKKQLADFEQRGATKEEIATFFRQQEKASGSVAGIVGSTEGWKNKLEEVWKQFPKPN